MLTESGKFLFLVIILCTFIKSLIFFIFYINFLEKIKAKGKECWDKEDLINISMGFSNNLISL